MTIEVSKRMVGTVLVAVTVLLMGALVVKASLSQESSPADSAASPGTSAATPQQHAPAAPAESAADGSQGEKSAPSTTAAKERSGDYNSALGGRIYPSLVFVPTDFGGFQPGEVVQVSSSDEASSSDKGGEIVYTHRLQADKQGRLRLVDFTGCPYCDQQMPQGDVVIRARGESSGHEEWARISVDHRLPAAPVAGPPAVYVEPRRGLLSTKGQVGTYFRFTGTGFTGPQPEQNKFEQVTLTLYAPNGQAAAQSTMWADKESRLVVVWILNDADIPGIWRLLLKGDNGHQAMARFYAGELND